MPISLEELRTGDFFTTATQLDSEKMEIYQKTSPLGDYNCVLINSGKPCNIHPHTKALRAINIEIKILEKVDKDHNQ